MCVFKARRFCGVTVSIAFGTARSGIPAGPRSMGVSGLRSQKCVMRGWLSAVSTFKQNPLPPEGLFPSHPTSAQSSRDSLPHTAKNYSSSIAANPPRLAISPDSACPRP